MASSSSFELLRMSLAEIRELLGRLREMLEHERQRSEIT
jgi:hypothetical protein